jgi:acetylornithine/succinyldiaminopimelate/putrescine aminotransferase
MGDLAGGPTANYHGTTVLAQALRGLWPGFAARAGAGGLFKVVPVGIDDPAGFVETFDRYNTGDHRIAGFCHEIVLMNYGGLLLDPEFLRLAYRHCHDHDVLVFCDEIQSGAWYEDLFLFRRYGLDPDLVAVGKGFPGGMYPASKILVTAGADRLSQFGALVTNGQEELASLSYLVTMEFARANGDHLRRIGQAYHERLDGLVARHPDLLAAITGDRHMAGIQFHDAAVATAFCRALEAEHGIDISTQAYKPSAPPTALTKLPLIADEVTLDVLLERMDAVLAALRPVRSGAVPSAPVASGSPR